MLSLSLRSYSNGKLQRTADEKKTPIFFGVHYYSWQLMCEGGIFFYSILSLCRQSRFQFDMCNKLRKYRSKNAHTICMRQSISMDGFFLSLLLSIFHCWIFFLLFFCTRIEWARQSGMKIAEKRKQQRNIEEEAAAAARTNRSFIKRHEWLRNERNGRIGKYIYFASLINQVERHTRQICVQSVSKYNLSCHPRSTYIYLVFTLSFLLLLKTLISFSLPTSK